MKLVFGKLQSDSFAGLLFSIVFALIYIMIIFPKGFITGTSSYWLTQQEDVTQYIAGFNVYFYEDWKFPLFKIESINYPEGTRSTFVDIIPIYSFFLKLLLPDSLFPFNPFGYWIGLSYVMTAISSWLILKYSKTSSWSALLTLTALLLIFPALSARLGHISLMSHWLILLGFVLYIRSFHKPFQIIAWSLLVVVSFYINIYIFTMVLSIFVATVITQWNMLVLNKNLQQLLLPFVFLFISLYITLLPLHDAGIAKDSGWGYYSMNLLSPFNGGKFIQFINAEMPGQYEGFNYLGLGVITLSVYAYILLQKQHSLFFKTHRFIIVLMFLFTFYSLSNHVYFGTHHLIDINYPNILDPLVSQFRASGRYFWPVGYALTIFAVIVTIKYNKKHGIVLILFALLLQVADLRDRLRGLHEIAKREQGKIIDRITWDSKIVESKNLYFYPKFRCSKNSSPHHTLLPVMLYASETKKTLNTGYIARYQPQCNNIGREIASANSDSSAFIFVKDEFPMYKMLPLYFPTSFNVICQELDFAYICKKSSVEFIKKEVELLAVSSIFSSQVGHFSEAGVESTDSQGFLIYGPYVTLPGGKYHVELLGEGRKIDNVFFDIVSENGNKVHAKTIVNQDKKNQILAKVDFTLDRDAINTEFRVFLDKNSKLTVNSVRIKRLD